MNEDERRSYNQGRAGGGVSWFEKNFDSAAYLRGRMNRDAASLSGDKTGPTNINGDTGAALIFIFKVLLIVGAVWLIVQLIKDHRPKGSPLDNAPDLGLHRLNDFGRPVPWQQANQFTAQRWCHTTPEHLADLKAEWTGIMKARLDAEERSFARSVLGTVVALCFALALIVRAIKSKRRKES